MFEKMKRIAVSLLMGFATVGAILVVFALLVVMINGIVIATQTHPAISIVCGLILSSIAFAVGYYGKI